MKTQYLLLLLTIGSLTGCVRTVQDIQNLYYEKPPHKALAEGTCRLRSNEKIVAAAWMASSEFEARMSALRECGKTADNCKVISVDGLPYIEENDPSTTEPSTSAPKVGRRVQAATSSPLRLAPAIGSQAIVRTYAGQRLTVTDQKIGWVKVRTATNNSGWLMLSEIKLLSEQPKSANIVENNGDQQSTDPCLEDVSARLLVDDFDKLEQQIINGCLSQPKKNTIEKFLYPIVKRIPGGNVEKNKHGYKMLTLLDPTNTMYQDKFKYYSMSDEDRRKLEAKRNKEKEEKEKERRGANRHEKVKRLYQSSSDFWRVVVTPDHQTMVKCALLDKYDNILVVREQIVTPPFDEVIIRAPGGASQLVESVTCSGL